MIRFHNKAFINLVIRLFFLFILLVVLLLFLRIDTLKLLFDKNVQGNWNASAKPFIPTKNTCGQDKAFEFIPKTTACKWAQTEFLIVFGIPSVDNDGRRRRRALQRATCWTFPGVATRANGHNGSMLVLYALAPHPAHGFALSESLRLEAAQWHDIISLPMNEGRVTTNKTIGGPGKWGNEAEIGMGRKTFFWLQLALRVFPLAVHVGKCDDDIFMQVPQYLADLRLLPRRRTYYGAYVGIMALKNKKMEYIGVKFMIGSCVALARDVAEAIVSYEPLRRIVSLPYTKERELDFCVLNVNYEDIMVGRALQETGYPVVVVIDQLRGRFHDSFENNGYRNITEHSVIIHHLRESDYHSYMSYFIDKGMNIQNTSIYKESPTLYWMIYQRK